MSWCVFHYSTGLRPGHNVHLAYIQCCCSESDFYFEIVLKHDINLNFQNVCAHSSSVTESAVKVQVKEPPVTVPEVSQSEPQRRAVCEVCSPPCSPSACGLHLAYFLCVGEKCLPQKQEKQNAFTF